MKLETEGEENEEPRYERVVDEEKDALVWPNFVVVLDTNSDALKERVARLDPEIKENSHHNEDGYARRILAFREKFPAFLENLQEGFQDEKTMVSAFRVEQQEVKEVQEEVLRWIT